MLATRGEVSAVPALKALEEGLALLGAGEAVILVGDLSCRVVMVVGEE